MLQAIMMINFRVNIVFFFNDTATTEIYTLSLHDALPIFSGYEDQLHKRDSQPLRAGGGGRLGGGYRHRPRRAHRAALSVRGDRKSTRLNSSHANISYAVFCLKKKNKYNSHMRH